MTIDEPNPRANRLIASLAASDMVTAGCEFTVHFSEDGRANFRWNTSNKRLSLRTGS